MTNMGNRIEDRVMLKDLVDRYATPSWLYPVLQGATTIRERTEKR